MAIEQAPVNQQIAEIFDTFQSIDPRYLRRNHGRRCETVLPPDTGDPPIQHKFPPPTLSLRLSPKNNSGDGFWILQLGQDLSKIVRVSGGREKHVVATYCARTINIYEELSSEERAGLKATINDISNGWETHKSTYAATP